MPGSSLNPSQCLLGDSLRFDKLNVKSSGSAVRQYCNSGIGLSSSSLKEQGLLQ